MANEFIASTTRAILGLTKLIDARLATEAENTCYAITQAIYQETRNLIHANRLEKETFMPSPFEYSFLIKTSRVIGNALCEYAKVYTKTSIEFASKNDISPDFEMRAHNLFIATIYYSRVLNYMET